MTGYRHIDLTSDSDKRSIKSMLTIWHDSKVYKTEVIIISSSSIHIVSDKVKNLTR